MSLRDKGIDVALWILCIDAAATIAWNSFGEVPAAFSIPYADKALHMLSYFTLAFLLLLVAVWRPGRGPSGLGNRGRLVVAGAAVFGILIEVAQGLWFERTADAVDALMNIAGIALAWAAWRFVKHVSAGSRFAGPDG